MKKREKRVALTEEQKEKIKYLFFNTSDNRTMVIAKKLNVKPPAVDCFLTKILKEKADCVQNR